MLLFINQTRLNPATDKLANDTTCTQDGVEMVWKRTCMFRICHCLMCTCASA